MPRNISGVMVLPTGNPVIPGTLIESTWANPTMADLANEITQSLPRNGAAPMTGPLVLARDGILPKEAITVDQLSAAVSSSTNYLPAGAVQYFAMNAVPTGWLEANGSAISRTTYANLFSTIGVTYGAGNGTTTFNLPDLRGTFIRGFDNGRGSDPGRGFGTMQDGANAPHNHPLSDPGHAHSASSPAHTHGISDPGHAHGISDPGHTHGVYDPGHAHTSYVPVGAGNAISSGSEVGPGATGAAGTGIGIYGAATGVGVQGAYSGVSAAGTAVGVSVAGAGTGITVASSGLEARPANMALIACIKAFGALQTDGLGTMAFQNKDAVQITCGTGVFSSLQSTKTPTEPNDVARLADIGGSIAEILSDDPQIILVDNTTPSTPILRIQTNVPHGALKLNASGLVPPALISLGGLNYQGPWNALPGVLPAGTFTDGDFFQITTAGTLTLRTPTGAVSQVCGIGDNIVWSSPNPVYPVAGFYYSPAPIPTNVVTKTSDTGAMHPPVGDTSQRPVSPIYGDERTNSELGAKEWWNGTNWIPTGGGQMLGQALVKAIHYNSQTIAENLTIAAGTNGFSAGPNITISPGFEVTIEPGANWVITS